MLLYRMTIWVLIFQVVKGAPVQDKQPQFPYTRPALDDFRIKQFFDTRTQTSLTLNDDEIRSSSSHHTDDVVVDDRPSSLEDINEGWDDAFNMDSPYPPFKPKKSSTKKKERKPRFIQNIDVKASRQATDLAQVSPLTATAEISSPATKRFLDHRRLPRLSDHTESTSHDKQPLLSFVRRPQKGKGVRNFSFPFRQREEVTSFSDNNRYSSVTNHVLNEYIDSNEEE